jgi:hypothetical protein
MTLVVPRQRLWTNFAKLCPNYGKVLRTNLARRKHQPLTRLQRGEDRKPYGDVYEF